MRDNKLEEKRIKIELFCQSVKKEMLDAGMKKDDQYKMVIDVLKETEKKKKEKNEVIDKEVASLFRKIVKKNFS